MASALLLILSAVLIGTGVRMIVRDARARRSASLERQVRDLSALENGKDTDQGFSRDSARDAIGPAHSQPGSIPLASAKPTAALPEPLRLPLRAVTDEPRAGGGDPGVQGEDRVPLAEEWGALQPMLDGVVETVNTLLAPRRLTLGKASAADWSYRQRGYGAYYRVLLGGDSVAWLRLELTAEARLHAALKAHSEDRAAINRTAECALADLDALRAVDMLLNCLRAAAGPLALPTEEARREAPPSAQIERATGIVASALRATNGAFAQAGARIVPLAPGVLEGQHPLRMTLRVEVDGSDVARMHIETLDDAMEVAVGAHDARLVALGRRHRLPLEGMTIHALAELIAGCAWPAIAYFQDDRRP
jgi:hypothetical protein